MLQTIAQSRFSSGSTKEIAFESLDQRIRRRLAQCSYRYYFNQVTWDLDAGHLKLFGRVPSFYMKQMLQTLLRDVDGVAQIDNRVDVVNAGGLSSEPST